mmetsp:Transcript_65502/g.75343  ORF Transcript_65502/g.75343 Transcript_65502/m.75343 type:complete len:282 (+) Transcript_65502:132-977(+)
MSESNIKLKACRICLPHGQYDGEVDSKKRFHGSGIFKNFNTGDTYEGEFRAGLREGFGEFTCSQGQYIGEWRKDHISGRGRFNYASGDVYIGVFKNGKKHGRGKLVLADGLEYEGEFEHDEFQGEGTLQTPEGDIYKGNFVNGLIQGKGKKTFKDGTTYDGDWKQNKRCGQGKQFFASDQTTYEGSWKADVIEGFGVMTTENERYEGEFKAGLREGQGRLTLGGDVYEGNLECKTKRIRQCILFGIGLLGNPFIANRLLPKRGNCQGVPYSWQWGPLFRTL